MLYGNVVSRLALPHSAYPRYVAVLDALGMKEWLRNESANKIAESLDQALIAAKDAKSWLPMSGLAMELYPQMIYERAVRLRKAPPSSEKYALKPAGKSATAQSAAVAKPGKTSTRSCAKKKSIAS